MPFNPSSPPRVLLLEDEAAVSLLIEDMLEDLGCVAAACVARADTALRALDAQDFDVAILDVNIGGQTSFEVARALRRRGVPFIFATGYGETGLPDEYRDAPVLQKPFALEDLEAALARVLNTGDGRPGAALRGA